MCGIAGIILKQHTEFNLPDKLNQLSKALKHRGPDGEGFILSGNKTEAYYADFRTYKRVELSYIPQKHLPVQDTDSKIGFLHRRLAIIDLSDTGHQPMCDQTEKIWITYNGEIYNYIELRSDLQNKGYSFVSESDTEVILAAYKEWGTACVEKFNGMWAFCIYDSAANICFASRDRFGVKPFYYLNTKTFFAFASEQKAFVESGLLKAEMDAKALHGYLINGLLENETKNFFSGVIELWPGTNMVFNLGTHELVLTSYFELEKVINLTNDGLSEKELVDKIEHTLLKSIELRLRSDVEVGTCLSGGIDSSVIAVCINKFAKLPVHCFTSVFKDPSLSEEMFADVVVHQINAVHTKVEPSLYGFNNEIETLVYSQDVPIWDTSTYAQYKVMELVKQQGVKVVLDGQGADELFGGYHHHFLAKWNNLIANKQFLKAFSDIRSSDKSIKNPFQFYFKERFKQKKYLNKKHFSKFFKTDFIETEPITNPSIHFDNVNQQLQHDIYQTRLKSFLKCEDRCGMWHSVESRTPFSDDIELIKLLFSFNGNRKIKNGVSKYLLREATKNLLPQEVYQRHDKKGFDTPMNDWMISNRSAMLEEIRAANFDFVKQEALDAFQSEHIFQNKLLFKLFVLSVWKKVFVTNLR